MKYLLHDGYFQVNTSSSVTLGQSQAFTLFGSPTYLDNGVSRATWIRENRLFNGVANPALDSIMGVYYWYPMDYYNSLDFWNAKTAAGDSLTKQYGQSYTPPVPTFGGPPGSGGVLTSGGVVQASPYNLSTRSGPFNLTSRLYDWSPTNPYLIRVPTVGTAGPRVLCFGGAICDGVPGLWVKGSISGSYPTTIGTMTTHPRIITQAWPLSDYVSGYDKVYTPATTMNPFTINLSHPFDPTIATDARSYSRGVSDDYYYPEWSGVYGSADLTQDGRPTPLPGTGSLVVYNALNIEARTAEYSYVRRSYSLPLETTIVVPSVTTGHSYSNLEFSFYGVRDLVTHLIPYPTQFMESSQSPFYAVFENDGSLVKLAEMPRKQISGSSYIWTPRNMSKCNLTGGVLFAGGVVPQITHQVFEETNRPVSADILTCSPKLVIDPVSPHDAINVHTDNGPFGVRVMYERGAQWSDITHNYGGSDYTTTIFKYTPSMTGSFTGAHLLLSGNQYDGADVPYLDQQPLQDILYFDYSTLQFNIIGQLPTALYGTKLVRLTDSVVFCFGGVTTVPTALSDWRTLSPSKLVYKIQLTGGAITSVTRWPDTAYGHVFAGAVVIDANRILVVSGTHYEVYDARSGSTSQGALTQGARYGCNVHRYISESYSQFILVGGWKAARLPYWSKLYKNSYGNPAIDPSEAGAFSGRLTYGGTITSGPSGGAYEIGGVNIYNWDVQNAHTPDPAQSIYFEYDYGTPVTVYGYTFNTFGYPPNSSYHDWTIPGGVDQWTVEGSTDGTNWTVVDAKSVTYTSYSNNPEIFITNSTPYRYYRFWVWHVAGIADAPSYFLPWGISNLQLYAKETEIICPIRHEGDGLSSQPQVIKDGWWTPNTRDHGDPGTFDYGGGHGGGFFYDFKYYTPTTAWNTRSEVLSALVTNQLDAIVFSADKTTSLAGGAVTLTLDALVETSPSVIKNLTSGQETTVTTQSVIVYPDQTSEYSLYLFKNDSTTYEKRLTITVYPFTLGLSSSLAPLGSPVYLTPAFHGTGIILPDNIPCTNGVPIEIFPSGSVGATVAYRLSVVYNGVTYTTPPVTVTLIAPSTPVITASSTSILNGASVDLTMGLGYYPSGILTADVGPGTGSVLTPGIPYTVTPPSNSTVGYRVATSYGGYSDISNWVYVTTSTGIGAGGTGYPLGMASHQTRTLHNSDPASLFVSGGEASSPAHMFWFPSHVGDVFSAVCYSNFPSTITIASSNMGYLTQSTYLTGNSAADVDSYVIPIGSEGTIPGVYQLEVTGYLGFRLNDQQPYTIEIQPGWGRFVGNISGESWHITPTDQPDGSLPALKTSGLSSMYSLASTSNSSGFKDPFIAGLSVSNGLTTSNTIMYLRDGDLTTLATSTVEGDHLMLVGYTAPTGRTNWLDIVSSGTGDYTLHYAPLTHLPAAPISVTGEYLDIEISNLSVFSPGDYAKVYTIIINYLQLLQFTATSTDFDPIVTVFTIDQTTGAFLQQAQNTGSGSVSVTYAAPTYGEEIYVEVAGANIGAYDLVCSVPLHAEFFYQAKHDGNENAIGVPPTVGQGVHFYSIAGGSPTQIFWDFGDGATIAKSTYSTNSNPSHTYGATGTYTATSTVYVGASQSSMSHTVGVIDLAVNSTLITYGDAPVTGTITTSDPQARWAYSNGNAKMFRFAGTAGDAFTITMVATGTMRPSLAVGKANGDQLWWNGNSSTLVISDIGTGQTLPYTGLYYVEVLDEGAGALGDGAFSIQVTKP